MARGKLIELMNFGVLGNGGERQRGSAYTPRVPPAHDRHTLPKTSQPIDIDDFL